MIDAPLALAFTAGLVASVNPCGFAMLPAYLSIYLGTDAQASDASLPVRLARALSVGVRVSVSFLVVFGVVGLLISAGVRSFIDYVPWVAIVIGVALAVLGAVLLAGKSISIRLPALRSKRTGTTRSTGDMVAFGASYAVASLSCTLPVFLAVVGATFTRSSLASGVATFAVYALGMTAVLLTVTISLAVAQHALVARIRSVSRHVNRIAGGLLILAGGYIVYYWAFTLATEPGQTGGAGPARFVEGLSADITSWLNNLGWQTIGIVLAAVIVTAGILVARQRRSRNTEYQPEAINP